MEVPHILKGAKHTDHRGRITYNNDFDLSRVKRIYTIENWNTETIRGWQGHKIERRWFSAIQGSFEIRLIQIDNWENPSRNCKMFIFELKGEELDVVNVPKGYVSSIQALQPNSKLLVMADYFLGEVKDEYRFDLNYFD